MITYRTGNALDPADLAVSASHRKQGIGRELVRRTRALGGAATVVLLSAPKAVGYYPRIGFTQHAQAWTLTVDEPLG